MNINFITEIFLWGILLSGLLNIFFGGKAISNRLACGLFAYNGDSAPNMDYIKILGIFNESRGEESCGIAIDNVVTKDTGKWTNFLQKNIIPKPTEVFTVLGHTRKSSKGAVSIDNAHPFEISSTDEFIADPVMIGAHNGTITNTHDLALKYGFKHSDFQVDSKLLLSIIADSKRDIKQLNVLNDYIGGAALIWYFIEEPNKLYVFKGASKKFKNAVETEERPLFYYKVKGENKVYISSLDTALKVIAEPKDNDDTGEVGDIKSFQTNRIYCIDNGKVTILKAVFDRSKAFTDYSNHQNYNYNDEEYDSRNQTRTTTKTNNTTTSLIVSEDHWENWKTRRNIVDPDNIFESFLALAVPTCILTGSSKDLPDMDYTHKIPTQLIKPTSKTVDAKFIRGNRAQLVPLNNYQFPILSAEPPLFSDKELTEIKSKVYFWRGSYWRNGNIIQEAKQFEDSIYWQYEVLTLNLDKHGYTLRHYTKPFHKSLLEKGYICDGDYSYRSKDDTGIITKEDFFHYLDHKYKHEDKLIEREFKSYHFCHGILFTELDKAEEFVMDCTTYSNTVFKETETNSPANIASYLMKNKNPHFFSKLGDLDGFAMWKGAFASGEIKPLFALRTYKFNCGSLIRITGKQVPFFYPTFDIEKKDTSKSIERMEAAMDAELVENKFNIVNNNIEIEMDTLDEERRDMYLDYILELENGSELGISMANAINKFKNSAELFETSDVNGPFGKTKKAIKRISKSLEDLHDELKELHVHLIENGPDFSVNTGEENKIKLYNN